MVILDIMAAQQGELYHFFLFKGTSSFPQKLQVLHFKLQVFLQKQQMSIDTLYRILQNKRQVIFLLFQIDRTNDIRNYDQDWHNTVSCIK